MVWRNDRWPCHRYPSPRRWHLSRSTHAEEDIGRPSPPLHSGGYALPGQRKWDHGGYSFWTSVEYVLVFIVYSIHYILPTVLHKISLKGVRFVFVFEAGGYKSNVISNECIIVDGKSMILSPLFLDFQIFGSSIILISKYSQNCEIIVDCQKFYGKRITSISISSTKTNRSVYIITKWVNKVIDEHGQWWIYFLAGVAEFVLLNASRHTFEVHRIPSFKYCFTLLVCNVLRD